MANDDPTRTEVTGENGTPSTDGVTNPETGTDNVRLGSTQISDQLGRQRASQVSIDNERATINQAQPGKTFFEQLKNLVGGEELDIDFDDIDAELDRRLALFKQQNDRDPTFAEFLSIKEEVYADVHTLEGRDVNSRYKKVSYFDNLRSYPDPAPEEVVELVDGKLVRYAEDDPLTKSDEGDGPVFLIDVLVYIQGVEISEFVQGQVRISLNGTPGHNSATLTLDNAHDRFIWSERNLYDIHGASAEEANAIYIQELNKRLAEAGIPEDPDNLFVEDDLQRSAIIAQLRFNQQERIKQAIYDYKTGNRDSNLVAPDQRDGKKRNPPIKNPKNALTHARFDLAPGRCIFNRMDPIRIFSLYPFRVPGKRYESESLASATGAVEDGGEFVVSARPELWMPEFTGYIDNISIDDDNTTGASRITIDCVDFRQAVLRRMRISSDLTSGLANPLDNLGFRLSKQAQLGVEAEQTAQDQQLTEQFSDNTEGWFSIDNTQFYDDILFSKFNQILPNKPLEGAVRELLVAKTPITTERNSRGVRGVELGGNFFYDSVNFTQDQARTFLESWHKFCLFGPKRRPWTREEVEYVGIRTTTDGVHAPNRVRLWFLLPIEGSGPKNLADLSQVTNPMNHDINWTNRQEVLQNFCESIDYNYMIAPHGDIIVEFNMSDFRPEDFGEFKRSFRVDKGLTGTQIGDEQEAPPAGMIVETGFAVGQTANHPIVQRDKTKTFVYSPYIAARYGIEIENESIPFLLARPEDQAIAQQRAVMLYQRRLARAHALSCQFTYRPFILPNRPIHHLRRYRIGRVVTCDKMLTLGQQPKGECVVGLEHVRTFTGHYRSDKDFEEGAFNDDQAKDNAEKGIDTTTAEGRNTLKGIDTTLGPDPIERQVFTTVAAGESTPTSARVGWSSESILAPASGIYVVDLTKVRPRPEEPSDEPVDEIEAEDRGDYDPPDEEPEGPEDQQYKFAENPLSTMYVTSNFGKRKSGTHTGIDLRARPAGTTPCYAVEDGVIKRAGSQQAPGTPVSGNNSVYGSGGNIVLLETDSGFWAQYLHLDDATRDLGLQFGQRVTAGQQIGVCGQSGGGSRTGAQPHLHFDLYALSRAINSDPPKVPQGTNVRQKLDPRPFFPGPVGGKPPRQGNS